MNITMNEPGCKWTLTDTELTVGKKIIPLSTITEIKPVKAEPTKWLNAAYVITYDNREFVSIGFSLKCKNEGFAAVEYIKEHSGINARNASDIERKKRNGVLHDLNGNRGRTMEVYEDRCVLKVKGTIGSLLTGNISDGEKTIFYSDCIGVQFKEYYIRIGYLQLETASMMMNNEDDNFFNENTFTFGSDVKDFGEPVADANAFMRELADYIRGQVAASKSGKNQAAVVQQVSAADELIKFKQLLDMGIITQEEFDAKKKQLLGL